MHRYLCFMQQHNIFPLFGDYSIMSYSMDMHIEYRSSQDISSIVKLMKVRLSRKLQMEFPELKKRYWVSHFWAIGFGCWSTRNITDERVNEYLEHHRNPNENKNGNFIIEDYCNLADF